MSATTEANGKPVTKASKRHRRVHTPTILQMEAVECGAAALGIVMAHLGRYVPLEELRTACGVSRDGSKASNVLRAGRSFGLLGKGFKKEPSDLLSMPYPLIVFWNFNHFVVLEGFGNGKAYLNDPAVGRRSVSAEEFDESFTGVILQFERGPEFLRGGKPASLWKTLGARLPGSRSALLYVILVTLALVLPGLVVPIFSKVFIDKILVGHLEKWLIPLLLVMGVTAVAQATLVGLQQGALMRLETRLSVASSSRFFWHVLRLPIEFFAQRYAGEIASRVEINDQVASLLSSGLATNVVNILTIGFYAALMFTYDVKLTAIGVVIAGLNLLALRLASVWRTDANRRLLQEKGKFMGLSMTGLQIMETLKSTGSETGFFARWSGHQAKVVNAEQTLGISSHLLSTVPALLLAVNTTAVLCLGGLHVMDGLLTIGMLIAFQSLMSSFLSPVDQLVNLGSSIQEMRGSLNRLDDVLRYPPEPLLRDNDNSNVLPERESAKLQGYVELRDVSFGYNKLEPPLIKGFNLLLKPGQRVALVGTSGSGKSTVSKLVSGLYEPWSGEVLLDGRPRAAWPRSKVKNSIALVDQEISLFEATIRENLTMWDSTVEDADMVQAAKDACIHDDIAARPRGYDSTLAEGGRDLSGGQRQRLEIARALTMNPRILVMDEATSALDPATEKLVDDNLHRRGCTLIIVAHRLSTIRDCDEILVMQYGRIVQRGTHNELASIPGPYANLIQSA